MRLTPLDNERGSVLMFVTALLVFLFVMAGVAIDVSYLAAARQELRRSMDAAALAGAGKLGFDDSVFPTARQFAQQFAGLNLYRNPWGGDVTLDLNPGNDSAGNIVLGIWDPTKPPAERFTPSLDGTVVNAVLCRFNTTIPTSFLNLLGFPSLPVQAGAIAISNPPSTIPNTATGCPFPIAVCAPDDTSGPCGQPITFISSNPGAPELRGDTAAWANLLGTGTPRTPDLVAQIRNAAGNCTGTSLSVGDPIGVNNGMIERAFEVVAEVFGEKYDQSVSEDLRYEVKDKDGNVTYNGYGWAVYVPLMRCVSDPLSGDQQIIGWSKMIITQVIQNAQGPRPRCVRDNPADTNSYPLCTDPALHESVRAIFGYFECTVFEDVNPIVNPGPRLGLGERLKLVR